MSCESSPTTRSQVSNLSTTLEMPASTRSQRCRSKSSELSSARPPLRPLVNMGSTASVTCCTTIEAIPVQPASEDEPVPAQIVNSPRSTATMTTTRLPTVVARAS